MKNKRRKKIVMAKFKRVFLFWTLLILLLFTGSFFIRLVKGLKSSVVAKQARITLVFLSNDLSLTIFSFENQKQVLLKATYENQDPKISLDDYIRDNYFLSSSGNFYGSFLKLNPEKIGSRSFLRRILLSAFTGKTKTNLNKYDLLAVFIKSFRFKGTNDVYDDFKSVPLGSFSDGKIREEALSLAVLNATSQAGLAQKMANFLENNGFRVIRVSDNQDPVVDCQIFYLKEGTYTLTWLKRVYSCQAFKEEESSGRADITIIFGDNQ